MSGSPATRRVTAADIAREVGVSRATVGFVMNATPGQTISAGTRDRVFAAARRLGYRPHLAAQALARGRTRIILLVLPDWPMEYSMSRHVDEASNFLDEAGYSLVTMTSHRGGNARPLWETLQPDVVMGMLHFDQDTFDDIRAAGVTAIIPDPSSAAAEPEAPVSAGPRLQVEHLLERGRRNLVYATSADPRLESLTSSRYALAAATVAEHDAGVLPEHAVNPENVAELVLRWAREGVDAVVAYNDDIAALVTGAAIRQGIEIPRQLAVIGHDDAPISRIFVPSITTVHLDDVGLGRYFADLALSAANGSPAPNAESSPQLSLTVRETT
ncbi:LacI family DNA-binding transcriptional regulator [Naasia lichenicola]|uniref:LacI family transcriptional regulator n=1 Tax=Naasia lichenicola TaxID=2565933 RepID=A0A4S4FQF1_9MICO|nr:LacI family DNA-binding transcriptional regulator [Naasia lichenicola]THG32823.1 LacI family transcriptional regulator [Naasia lichenicola]